VNIIVPALAVAFAAFCVWLGVRIFNRRERWAKWTLAVTIMLPVLYVVSIGPASWLVARDPSRIRLFLDVYGRFICLTCGESEPLTNEMTGYVALWIGPDSASELITISLVAIYE
jgi:hypothetical protein